MDENLKVALVQSPIVWENPEQNRINFSKKIETVCKGTDLIVLPEMFTTGFTMTPENLDDVSGKETLEWMKEVSNAQNAALVGSIPWLENKKYTNRLFFVAPSNYTFWYDKRHTFTLAGEDKVYEAGTDRLIVDYKGFKICPLICYDLRFPVWARNTADYDVLIYVANWPKPRISAWDVLLKARAIENMAYCIGVNRIGSDEKELQYTGHSAVYDVLGEPLSFSKVDEIIYATLSKKHITSTRKQLKFLEDKDNFNLEV